MNLSNILSGLLRLVANEIDADPPKALQSKPKRLAAPKRKDAKAKQGETK